MRTIEPYTPKQLMSRNLPDSAIRIVNELLEEKFSTGAGGRGPT